MKSFIVAGLLAFTLPGWCLAQTQETTQKPPAELCTRATMDLRMNARKLAEEHLTFTRNFIISTLAGLDDADAVGDRLLKNVDDIRAAANIYYGIIPSMTMKSLLKDHVLLGAEVVKAAKSGDPQALAAAAKKWQDNSDTIAGFLATANPNWSQPMLTEVMRKHLELTSAEVTARLKKDWNGDIDAYDKGHDHILMIADIFSDGIIKQFPEKFK